MEGDNNRGHIHLAGPLWMAGVLLPLSRLLHSKQHVWFQEPVRMARVVMMVVSSSSWCDAAGILLCVCFVVDGRFDGVLRCVIRRPFFSISYQVLYQEHYPMHLLGRENLRTYSTCYITRNLVI